MGVLMYYNNTFASFRMYKVKIIKRLKPDRLKPMIMRYFFPVLVLILLISCDNKKTVPNKEIRNIPMEVEVFRFEKEFAEAGPEDLFQLKEKYPLFFPEQFDDEFWVEKMNDTLQIELEDEVLKTFPDLNKLEEDLESLFKHIKYYFPKFRSPKVYTVTSDWDPHTKVILADSILIIALDNYLGEEHFFYQGLERYFVKNMKPDQILPDVAEAFGEKYVMPPKNRTLLEQMIYHGKILYLKDIWLPEISDAEKIGYTKEEYEWAEDNEVYMWQYFIENELLHNTDSKLPARFIHPAPFSKFYLEIDNESPGRLGIYLGWKIVRAYMKNNDVSPMELLGIGGEEIYKKSKFKPKK